MKKDEARFTIKFCLADPRHRKAVEVLNAVGRRKASLIADAVCAYLAQDGAMTVSFAANADNAANAAKTANTAPNLPVAADNTAHDKAITDNNIHQAILSGLSMFGG